MDLGLRHDSSALVIAHRRGPIIRVAEILEMRPTAEEPLKPSVVVRTFAQRIKVHGGTYAVGDAHYRDAIIEYLSESKLSYVLAPSTPADAFMRARALMREGRVRIPRHDRLIRQLSEVQGVATSGGRMQITQPRGKGQGHGDIVSAFVLAVFQLSGTLVPAEKPKLGSEAWQEQEREARRAKAREANDSRTWWKR